VASSEQAAGIEQVNRALAHMDEVIQQNSALVEENAATAKTLEGQSKGMTDRVAVFRIGKVVERNHQLRSAGPTKSVVESTRNKPRSIAATRLAAVR